MALCRQGRQGWDETLREKAVNGLFGSRALRSLWPLAQAQWGQEGPRSCQRTLKNRCYPTSAAS